MESWVFGCVLRLQVRNFDKGLHWWLMTKHTLGLQHSHETKGLNLPVNRWQALDRVGFGCAVAGDHCASVLAFPDEPIEKKRDALELELGETAR